MSIYKKLLKIQKKVKGLSKDKKSHQYDYVSGNKLLSFIRPIMDEEGLVLKQEVVDIENTRQDYEIWDKYNKQMKPKAEILTKVNMRFTWVDVSTGETDVNLFAANGQNDWEKGLGSALTYGERYFLLKYFHIATDEDDIDNPNRKKDDGVAAPVKSKATPSQGISQDKFDKAVAYIKEGGSMEAIKKKYQLSKEQEETLKKL